MAKAPQENIDSAMVNNPLMRFIGAENIKKIQDGFVEILLKQVKDDFRIYGEYIFYPPNHEEIIEDAFNKVSKKIQKMYEGAMLELAQKSVDKWKEIAMQDIGEKIDEQ